MSTTCQKAKSCPQPAKKQNSSHNPMQIVASICFHKQKKGSPLSRSVMDPDRGVPLKQGFSSLMLCISCQQNYRLDVARGNETTNSYLRR